MKRKINIFACLFILLTILPTFGGMLGNCGDESDCCEETSIPEEHSDDHNCLSFCFCSCCGPTVLYDLENKIIPQPKLFSILNTSFIYQSPTSINISFDIWQPPKSA